MAISIRPVASIREYLNVCRLRYEVYVEERRVPEQYANHLRRMIAEPLDEQGTLLAAFDGDKVVGTVRSNLGDDPHIGPYADFYQMNKFGQVPPRQTAIVTKLMVDQSHRSSLLGMRLVRAIYEHNLYGGVRFVFIDSNENLLQLYERLGFVPHCEDVVHPVYGLVRRMMIDMQDLPHMQLVRSPLLPILRQWMRMVPSETNPCMTESLLAAA